MILGGWFGTFVLHSSFPSSLLFGHFRGDFHRRPVRLFPPNGRMFWGVDKRIRVDSVVHELNNGIHDTQHIPVFKQRTGRIRGILLDSTSHAYFAVIAILIASILVRNQKNTYFCSASLMFQLPYQANCRLTKGHKRTLSGAFFCSFCLFFIRTNLSVSVQTSEKEPFRQKNKRLSSKKASQYAGRQSLGCYGGRPERHFTQ